MTVFARLRGRQQAFGGRRAALVFALFAALLFQSVVTAGHVHVPASAGATILGDAGAAKLPAHPRAPADPATNCPICHAVSQAGNYLAPAPIVFVALIAAAIWLFAPAFRGSSPTLRSHAWLSRAPPA